MRYLVFLLLFGACGEVNFTPLEGAVLVQWADGDSGEIDGVRFRLANVDAPEIGTPECDGE